MWLLDRCQPVLRADIRGCFTPRGVNDLWCVRKGLDLNGLVESALQGPCVPHRPRPPSKTPRHPFPYQVTSWEIRSWIQRPRPGCEAACIPDSVASCCQDLPFEGGGGFSNCLEKVSLQKNWFRKPKHEKKAMAKEPSLVEFPRVIITCPRLETCFDFKCLASCNNTHLAKETSMRLVAK